MSIDAGAVAGGLRDPVFQAQVAFRQLMSGMSRPGTRQKVSIDTEAPADLPRVSAVVALTLCDADTPIGLSESLRHTDAVGRWLRFHTGSPVVPDIVAARFVIVSLQDEWPAFTSLAQGSDEYPDRSAMLLAPVDGFDGGSPLILSGPGIAETRMIAPHPIPDDFLSRWQANGAIFPCGIDLILLSEHEFVCLPRTTRVVSEAIP